MCTNSKIRRFLNKILFLLAVCKFSASAAISAESPDALLKEVAIAFETSDSTALSNREARILITGDMPILAGPLPVDDSDQLAAIFPSKYDIVSVKLVPAEEFKSVLKRATPSAGYVRVDFKRKENVQTKARITAFARLYPYIQTKQGYYLLTSNKHAQGN